jgi:sugar phosphate isomerase/epimerase
MSLLGSEGIEAMANPTRRDLIRGTAMAMAGGWAGVLGSQTARAIPPIGRTRPSHLKLSIAAYSYRDYLTGANPKMDLFGYADLAADMGLDAIEPTSYYFPKDVTPEYLNRFKLHAFKLGLDISGTAVGNNFCLPPGPRRDEQITLVERWIDRAAELDAPVIRIFAGNVARGATEAQAVEWAIEGIKAVLPYAAKKGIVLALENHGGITATPAQLLKIVKAIDAPNFGINLDSGNFHTADPYADLAEIAPYAVNAQVKTEMKRDGEKGTTPADLARIINILRDAKYSGYVVLEYEAKEDPLTAIPGHIKALRKLLDA